MVKHLRPLPTPERRHNAGSKFWNRYGTLATALSELGFFFIFYGGATVGSEESGFCGTENLGFVELQVKSH